MFCTKVMRIFKEIWSSICAIVMCIKNNNKNLNKSLQEEYNILHSYVKKINSFI